jgi:hypothetical protein
VRRRAIPTPWSRTLREASQAPRNSRELAVRNQFFTPRYVVQFLTDNTLGRIWYEMRGGETALVDRCEYMVRRPDETYAPRAKKDPRDLRVLDPACGSGHFLLYAFDLLIPIYEEAHADPNSPKSEATGRTLANDYPSIDALRRALPALVLAHNLHGVDIDPRCAQIAQLALWMRAQRAFRDSGVSRADRPVIWRSNIVVAEPLVTDEALLKEFLAKLGDNELGRVFTDLVKTLELAGDLGLLLRVETLMARGPKRGETGDLFAPPEARIRAALANFVTASSTLSGTRRRLFADDAAQGVGLLETAEKKFDVVLMNPPFGAGSNRAKKNFEKAYPRTKNDVYAAFVERGIGLLHPKARLGAITSRTGFFLSSFQKWREDVLLKSAPPVVFADLGAGVLDSAMVETAAYCLERSVDGLLLGSAAMTVFLRILDAWVDEKATELLRAVNAARSSSAQLSACNHAVFEREPEAFAELPGSPFAYWVSKRVRHLFGALPRFDTGGRLACRTNSVDNDFRYVRSWWEVDNASLGGPWRSWAKGGAFSPWHYDVDTVIAWDAARSTYTGFLGTENRPLERPASVQHFFRPGITWPRRTNGLSFRVLPRGCVFGDKGPAAFVDGDDSFQLLALAAILNSRTFGYLMAVQLARTELAQSYEVGLIQQTPVPDLSNPSIEALADLARRAWSLKRRLDQTKETSHAFLLPPGPIEQLTGFDRAEIERQLAAIQHEIDDRTFDLYGVGPEERSTIAESAKSAESSAISEANTVDEAHGDERSEEEYMPVGAPKHALPSWLLGVAFGRFDKRLATGERGIPPEPEPFDPLPSRSPGMWPENEPRGLIPPDILVDDTGHAHDLAAHATNASVGTGFTVHDNLGQWLAREFFPLHIKMYSKSRRKAPIYWQLATPSASYSVWLYLHAFTRDTLYKVQNDYVVPKLAHEERRLESLRREQGNPTAADRKSLAAQETFVDELRALLDEVKRIAPLWNPNLDDGVIVNFAPLWRLVPHHKPWQKECRECWDKLCAGDYDWAHLAMHLWPERVVPKCATDRSLAIAHDLEEAFWEELDGKWKARGTPTRDVDAIVRERTSPAVKTALQSLLTAPTQGTTTTSRSRAKTAGRSRKAKEGA